MAGAQKILLEKRGRENRFSTPFLLFQSVEKKARKIFNHQQQIQFSSFLGLFELIVLKDNLIRMINDLVDFTFIYEELVSKY